MVTFIDPKRAYLSAHWLYVPETVGETRLLMPEGKPQKIMEFQVPWFPLEVPRSKSDATRWQRGAPCCGVRRRVGWMLCPPRWPRPVAPDRRGRDKPHCGSSAVLQARAPPSRVPSLDHLGEILPQSHGSFQVARSEQRLGPTPGRCWGGEGDQLQLVRYLPQVDRAWLQIRYSLRQPPRNCAEVHPKRHEHILNGRAGMPAAVL
jgi:hypothetical protein